MHKLWKTQNILVVINTVGDFKNTSGYITVKTAKIKIN